MLIELCLSCSSIIIVNDVSCKIKLYIFISYEIYFAKTMNLKSCARREKAQGSVTYQTPTRACYKLLFQHYFVTGMAELTTWPKLILG